MRSVNLRAKLVKLDVPVLSVNGTPQRMGVRRGGRFAVSINDLVAQLFAPAAAATP